MDDVCMVSMHIIFSLQDIRKQCTSQEHELEAKTPLAQLQPLLCFLAGQPLDGKPYKNWEIYKWTNEKVCLWLSATHVIY